MTKSHLFFLIFLLMVNKISHAKNIVRLTATEPSQKSLNLIEIGDVNITSTQLITHKQFRKKWCCCDLLRFYQTL